MCVLRSCACRIVSELGLLHGNKMKLLSTYTSVRKLVLEENRQISFDPKQCMQTCFLKVATLLFRQTERLT